MVQAPRYLLVAQFKLHLVGVVHGQRLRQGKDMLRLIVADQSTSDDLEAGLAACSAAAGSRICKCACKSSASIAHVFATKDTAAHVLRFQHEDAERREEHVINLDGAARRVQRDVMQVAVNRLVQLPMGEQLHQQFADVAFSPRRLEQADQQHQRDKPALSPPPRP